METKEKIVNQTKVTAKNIVNIQGRGTGIKPNKKRPHVLVLDDDPTFLALVRQEAKIRKIPITVCSSVKELSALGSPALFDAAVVDYYLDNVKDYFNGAEVAGIFGPTPVLLISSTNRCVDESSSWPTSVRKFMNKKSGVADILDTAIRMGHGVPEKGGL